MHMRILHISTHNENCGIGKYQEMYLAAMKHHDQEVRNDFFPYSPNYIIKQSGSKLEKVLSDLDKMVADYDLVHIQHEFSFYKSHQLKKIVAIIQKHNKRFIATIHTKPILRPPAGSRMTVSGWAHRARIKASNYRYLEAISPLKKADLVIVHNDFTRDGLIQVGFDPSRIIIKPIPVPVLDIFLDKYITELDDINAKLNRKKGDVVFAAVGYLAEVKGSLQAVKALSLLPENYKLLMVGGIHPTGKNDEILDQISDLIVKRNLQDRIYITGFVEDDLLLNAYVANADIVIYPYLREYASSSAALNNAFASNKPVVAFPAPAFKEINKTEKHMILAESFSYYDLAREIANLDEEKRKQWSAVSEKYSTANSYSALAKEMLDIYKTHLT